MKTFTSRDAVGLPPDRVAALLGAKWPVLTPAAVPDQKPADLTPQRVGFVRRLLRTGFTRAGVSRHLSIPMDVLNRALARRR